MLGPTLFKNSINASSSERGFTFITLQPIYLQTCSERVVNTNLQPLLPLGLGIPTSSRETLSHTSSRIRTCFPSLFSISDNIAARLSLSPSLGQFFNSKAPAISSCTFFTLNSFDMVTQITLSNLCCFKRSLWMCFMIVVLPTPPIPQTPMLLISSCIKHAQISFLTASSPTSSDVGSGNPALGPSMARPSDALGALSRNPFISRLFSSTSFPLQARQRYLPFLTLFSTTCASLIISFTSFNQFSTPFFGIFPRGRRSSAFNYSSISSILQFNSSLILLKFLT
ncbi:hypothetical protein E1A91_A04G041700v1 [Gossypium mustelinum]|uniref:Uncharacterized protein n=1 Tax=Gossypium mustelinum TaxID=34275 RepID=A0A5D2ZLU3_GOSMU|nr:hypothetical protein E1A91_A04G041700v1 [Gossypium mustelinum]